MKPKDFPESNILYAKDQPEYLPLPAHKNEIGDVVTCWELTDEELEKVKESKCVYLSVKTFNHPLQPLYLTTEKTDVIDIVECIGCSGKFDYETMQQDDAGEDYCPECASEMFPVMKSEYEELKAKGEVE